MKKIYFFISAAIILAAAAAICLLKKDSKMNSLNTTDPELAALWNNFMNADVLPHGSLEVKTRALVLFAGHVAAGSVNEYKMLLAQALDNGGAKTKPVKKSKFQQKLEDMQRMQEQRMKQMPKKK